MDTNKILFRASSLHNLLIEPKKKTELLSETTKTFLQKLALDLFYNRTVEIKSKYLQKGIETESESFNMINQYFNTFFKKNDIELSNDYIKGTADYGELNKLVFDVKNSFTHQTFKILDIECDNKTYETQLQAYMLLWNVPTSLLIYTLNDMPSNMIFSIAKKEAYDKNINFESIEFTNLYNEITYNYTYFDVPLHEKIKIFEVKRDPYFSDIINEKIINARNYLKELFQTMQNNKNILDSFEKTINS